MRIFISLCFSFFTFSHLFAEHRVSPEDLAKIEYGIQAVGKTVLPAQYHLCKTPKGLFITRTNDQHVGWVMARGRHWEEDLVNYCEQFVTPNSTVVDIGANIGTHTVSWAKKAKAVYAFEPQRPIFQQLCANLLLNDCNNVHAIHTALGHKPGTACLDSTVPAVSGMSPKRSLSYEKSTTPLNFGGVCLGDDGEKVEMRTLDSYQLENVSLIKVDVEGAEPLVFYGAKETIRQNRPVIVYEKRPDCTVSEKMIANLNLTKEVIAFDIEAFVATELADVYHPPRDLTSNGDRVLIPKNYKVD